MRITGGILRGRIVKVPRSVVRPTQDRVREALFSILGDRVEKSVFLDLFAGSGSVGLEAWSRGAGRVFWVESGKSVLRCLNENVDSLCRQEMPAVGPGDRFVSVHGTDVRRFLKKNVADCGFDIIFADPPYSRGQRSKVSRRRPDAQAIGTMACQGGQQTQSGWCEVLLKAIDDGGILAPGGVFIMEQAADTDVPEARNWLLVDEKVYGGTKVVFFEKEPVE